MIFVTVGNMDPFDRLIKAIDAWVSTNPSDEKVFAQIGNGQYIPTNCEYIRHLTPDEFEKTFREARLVISHAGIGTIITALELGKPIIVVPKRASLGEQRNEHQLATVRRFRRSKLMMVADTEADLPGVISRWDSTQLPAEELDEETSRKQTWSPGEKLLKYVRNFVQDQPQAGKILLTVGNEPMDRLVKAFDEWIGSRPDVQAKGAVAQIADGGYVPKNCDFIRFMTPAVYRQMIDQAELIVAHAGIGTIITAMNANRLIVVMPRQARFGETRNDHQLATVKHFSPSPQRLIAESEAELSEVLDRAVELHRTQANDSTSASPPAQRPPDESLLRFLREFVS
jgi:UDP-N-acetylglucosamine transferase subunit ALG13